MEAPTVDQVLELALHHFAGRGIDVTLTDDGLATEDGCIFGLEPLRRRLAEVEETEWDQAVDRHFRVLMEVDREMPATFAEARPNLRSAVVGEADLGWFDGAILERPVVEGLGERLMLRRGSLAMTVTRETVSSWGVGEEEVWEAARDGVRWDEPVIVEEMVKEETCYSALRGGRWTSTRVLELDRFVGPAPEFGVLAAVPARDEVLFHEIRDESFLEAAVAILKHLSFSFSRAPLPVACDLFWWWEGALHRICAPGQSGYDYVRVPEFSAAMWRLEERTTDQAKCRRQMGG